MREYLEIGATPCEENCAQVGSPDYTERARKECKAYINQLWRFIKKEKGLDPDAAPTSFNLVVRSQPHDFGSYYEVAARYDDINADAADLAYFLESEGPTTWDDEAKKELQG